MQIQSLPILKNCLSGQVSVSVRQGRRVVVQFHRNISKQKKIPYVLYLILTFLNKSPNKTRTTPANAAGYSQIVCQS